MRRVRQLAIVLLALGVVTAAIYATGAFTSLTAQRNADVAVAGDASAYLSLKPSSGPNGEYASYDAHGQLQIVLGDDATGGGVNRDAVTIFRNVFTITNQGSQTIGLWLTDGSDAVTFQVNGQSIEGKGQAIEIAPGTTKSVGLVVDTRQVSENQDLLGSVTFHSSSAVSGSSGGSGSGGSADKPVMDSPPSSQTDKPPASPSKEEDDGSNSKYEDCGLWDINCYKRNAGDFVGSIIPGGDNGGGSSSEKSTVNAIVGTPIPGTEPILIHPDKLSEGLNKFIEGIDKIKELSNYDNERIIGSPVPGTGPVLIHFDKVRDRYFTEDGKFDLTGNGIPIREEINDHIPVIPRGNLFITKISDSFVSAIDGPADHFAGSSDEWTASWLNIVSEGEFSRKKAVINILYVLPLSSIPLVSTQTKTKLKSYILENHYYAIYPEIKQFQKGMVYGTAGMPGGVAYDPNCDPVHEVKCVSQETANSEFYFAGHMLLSFVPVVSTGVDIRDGIQNLASGNYVDAGINAFGLVVPFVSGKAIVKGVDIVAGRLDDIPIKITDDISFLDDLTGGAVTSLKKKGFSEEYIQAAKRKGYNPKKMNELIKKKNIPKEDVRYYVDNDVPLRWVEDLQIWGVDPDTIRELTEETINIKRYTVEGVEFYGKVRSYCSWEKAQPGNPNPDIRNACQIIKSKQEKKQQI
jgi:hypothetical protein